MLRNQQRQSYVNALIFTVVTFVLSLLVLGALVYNGSWKEYLVFFLVLQVGIFGIILWCIKILKDYEKLYNANKDPRNYTIPFDSCPDYYTKKFDADLKKHYCSNEHIVVNPTNVNKPKRIMKIVPERSSFPDVHETAFVQDKQSPLDKFSTDALFVQTIKDDNTRCGIISEKGPQWTGAPYDPTKVMYDNFKKVSWTSLRPRCDGLFYAK